MRKITQSTAQSGRILAALVLVLGLTAAAGATRHPTMIDPGTAKCTTCHEEVLEAEVVHPPVADDCLSCHDFATEEDGLHVSLMAEGPALCIMCHDQLEAAAAAEIEAPHAPVTDDCTSCHSPHGSNEAFLLLAPVAQLCFDCHDADDSNKTHDLPVSRADCRSCHAPHGSDTPAMLMGTEQHAPFAEGMCESCHRKPRGTKVRMRGRGAELCYACHSDLEKDFAGGTVHTAVKNGMCTGCHDPHVADQGKMLEAEGSELCFFCHPEIEAKLAAEVVHAAVEEGCDGCHDPHRSDYPKQLLHALPDLCLMCHDGDDEDLKAKHLGADLSSAACTTCHDPHGSSEQHLMNTGSVHPPFVEDCETCHEGGAGQVLEGGGSNLCYACHSEIEEVVASAPVGHAAMEMADCTACHTPHASANTKLLRAHGPGVCTTCHEDMVAGDGEVNHGVIDWVGCHSCHEPHGGTKKKLLRAVANELCNGCHLDRLEQKSADGGLVLPGGFEVKGRTASGLRFIGLNNARSADHPIPSHPVSGTISRDRKSDLPPSLEGQEMSCLSCHTPHSARHRQLFRFSAASSAELCSACHAK